MTESCAKRNQAETESEGGARGDMLNCGTEKCCAPDVMETILGISEEAIERSLSGMIAGESEKLLKICLGVLLWHWITALGRGFGMPEPEDIPVCHGRRIPSEVRLMVSSIRKKIVVFLLLYTGRNTEKWIRF